jgi:hypothetical protein
MFPAGWLTSAVFYIGNFAAGVEPHQQTPVDTPRQERLTGGHRFISILGKRSERSRRTVTPPTQEKRERVCTRRAVPIAIFLLLGLLMGGCEIWGLERGIKQMGRGIQEAEGLGMEEAALYHLQVARSLLEAAEAQYEQADFPSATQFLDQSEQQLARARRLHTMSQPAPP